MEYQNLFTQTQVTGPASHGVPINAYDMRERTKTIGFSHLMGRLGNAQLGPIYLGRLGVASLMFGMTAFFIIGMIISIIAFSEPFSIGIMNNKTLAIISDQSNNMTRSGKITMSYHRISFC